MGEWISQTLGDVCSTITDGAHQSPKEDLHGLPMASVKDLTRYGINLQGCKRIPASDFQVLKRQGCQPEKGDVLIAKDGNSALDTVCVYESDMEIVLLSSVAILRPNHKIDSNFLRYYLDSAETRNLLKASFRSGSAIPRVVLKDFRRAPIKFPPINEQRRISQILRSLDDKIELNRKTNETLEAMARALFKSWFVDFDPVRAKAEGRDTGLPKEIADLFPDSFENSELGEIPKGWKTVPLYDCAFFINGLAFNRSHFSQTGEGLPVIKIAELKEGITEKTKFCKEDVDSKYRVKSGDVLFSWSGSPDTSIDIFVWSGIDGWLNQHIFKVEFKAPEEKVFVYFLLRHFLPVFIEIARNKQTTGLGHVTSEDLRRLKTVFPSNPFLHHFNKSAEDLFQKIYIANCESALLSRTRNALLPKLISGELCVENKPEDGFTDG